MQTCDLLIITACTPRNNWYDAKRYLKMRLPWVGHGAPHLNLYVHTLHDVEASCMPFIYLARREDVVLYRSHSRKFARPKGIFDFSQAASAASRYAGTFLPQADRLVGYAEKRIDRAYQRESAFARRRLHRTLYYVYHGVEADTARADPAPPSAHIVGQAAAAVRTE